MVTKKTIFKILEIERLYGSLWEAYSSNKLSYSTYHRYRKIILSGVVYTDENFKEFEK